MAPLRSRYGDSFDMMVVPEAANMPPTPWQTEILAPGICAGAIPHLKHALLQGVHAVHAGMHVGETAAIGVERQFAAGSGVALGDKGAGLAARHKAQILQAVDRQMREGVVDHQMVDVLVRDAGLGKGSGAGDAERAGRGVFLVTLARAGVQGDRQNPGALASCFRRNDDGGLPSASRHSRRCRGGRPVLREIAGALGGDQDQRAAVVGHQAALR